MKQPGQPPLPHRVVLADTGRDKDSVFPTKLSPDAVIRHE